jgi:hypothetical protein
MKPGPNKPRPPKPPVKPKEIKKGVKKAAAKKYVVNDAAYKVKSGPKPKGPSKYYTVPGPDVLKKQVKQVNKYTNPKYPQPLPGKPADKTSFKLQGKKLTEYYKLGTNMAKAYHRDPIKAMPARSHYMLIQNKNYEAAWKKGYADAMSKLKKGKK